MDGILDGGEQEEYGFLNMNTEVSTPEAGGYKSYEGEQQQQQRRQEYQQTRESSDQAPSMNWSEPVVRRSIPRASPSQIVENAGQNQRNNYTTVSGENQNKERQYIQANDETVQKLFQSEPASTVEDQTNRPRLLSSLLSGNESSQTPREILPQRPSAFVGIYSSTGFDLLTLLACIVNRPNPVVHIGPVDLSCSFVVTDVRKPDCPIVYVSPQFEKLTGYDASELVGINCRFLQDPSGKVPKGSERKYCDNGIIYQIKKSVTTFKESQFTIINYKKGGEPFMNYLTIIPISMDGTENITHFVGLQVDLVNQPQAILERMRDGSYLVNYSTPVPPRPKFPLRAPAPTPAMRNVSEPVVESHSPTSKQTESTPLPRFMASWPETFPDLVHVISFRGLILYISPEACRSILEYEPSSLVRKNVSEFIHPADFVTVMRELRTCPPNGAINYLCRMRRKQNGYVYMQVSGHMYNWGKRTRCFILSGRELSYAPRMVSREILGFDATRELCGWMKVTRQGLILFATADCEVIFERSVDYIIAQSILDFVAKEYKLLVLEYLRKVADSFSENQDAFSFPATVVEVESGRTCGMRFFAYSEGLCNAVLIQLRTPLDRNAPLPTLIPTLTTSETGADQVENLFDYMEETCTSSVQYELNRLKVSNKKLQAELERLEMPPA